MNPLSNDNLHHPKITAAHLQRLAYIYVRQSSPKQVAQNKESQAYQYRLQQRAHELGWAEERIHVIDSDLGLSGKEAAGRSGFQELVAEVSMGNVGIVFGYEVSRLARNNRDWYMLLDLSAVFGTLIADNDGVYDPRQYNDRLLLGLKGTMSEAELHLLHERLYAGRMNQVKRGAYRQQLPTGYVRLPNGNVEKDPDDQVRHVIELVFDRFMALGSAGKVVRYLREHDILLPRRQTWGPQTNQLLWKVATEAAVSEILTNPAYAGTFAYGRRQMDPKIGKEGQKTYTNRRKPPETWLYVQQNVYPAYITWEQSETILERIHQNGLFFMEQRQKAQGIEREGPGLLQGLVICGKCGHHMRTAYRETPRYLCSSPSRTMNTPSTIVCTSVRAPVVDHLVIETFFQALQPAQLDTLDAVIASQRADRERLETHWQEQQALHEREEGYRHYKQMPLPAAVPPQLREVFSQISQRLPDLWPILSNVQRKELLRSLIQSVIVKRPVADQIEVRIVWVSGCYTEEADLTPISRGKDVSGYAEMETRIGELCQQGLGDKRIAEQLTAEGFHCARSREVSSTSVKKIRYAHHWYLPYEQVRGTDEVGDSLTVLGLSKVIGTKKSAIYHWIEDGMIPADHVTREPKAGMYLIRKDDVLFDHLRKHVLEKKKKNGLRKSAE